MRGSGPTLGRFQRAGAGWWNSRRALSLLYRTELTQLYRVAHLFDSDVIVHNFQHSANRVFQRYDFEPTRETIALWRTIAADLDGAR